MGCAPESRPRGIKEFTVRWPAKALERAVKQMCSPCVGGDLLQQRAPALVPHVYSLGRMSQGRNGVELHGGAYVRGISAAQLTHFLGNMSCYLLAAAEGGQVDVLGAQELSLLLEVSEMYCHVSPSSAFAPLQKHAWPILSAVHACSPHSLASFASTSGEALISIAEHLVEDVLLVMGTATGSHSNSKQQPRHGAGNPDVTLKHRRAWAQDVLLTLGLLCRPRPSMDCRLGQGGDGTGVTSSLFTSSTTLRLSRLMETALRSPHLIQGGPVLPPYLLPHTLPALYAAASSPTGCEALLLATITAVKRQQADQAVLAALVEAGGQLKPAAAGVVTAVPGPMGNALAQQVQRHTASSVQLACASGLRLASLAEALLTRAAALVDPELCQAATCRAQGLPAGCSDKPWTAEALFGDPGHSALFMLPYKTLLGTSSQQLASVTKGLESALSQQHAAPARKQAAKLAQGLGTSKQAADTEQLYQQLQGMWLGRGVQKGPQQQKGVPAGGGPAMSAAAHSISSDDLRVAATALLMACKAAGAVAQLPQLLEQVVGIAGKQPWGRALDGGSTAAASMDLSPLNDICSSVAEWVLLLAPVLGRLLPAEQAAQLQEAAAGAPGDDEHTLLLTPDMVSCVLGLLGHAVAPGAPGCSYPSCCNLEGSSEAELPLQACSNCRGARYCCREHQAAHWKAGHKEVCQAAQAAAKQVCGVAAGKSNQAAVNQMCDVAAGGRDQGDNSISGWTGVLRKAVGQSFVLPKRWS